MSPYVSKTSVKWEQNKFISTPVPRGEGTLGLHRWEGNGSSLLGSRQVLTEMLGLGSASGRVLDVNDNPWPVIVPQHVVPSFLFAVKRFHKGLPHALGFMDFVFHSTCVTG